MSTSALFTLSQLMFAHLLKDALQVSVHVRALVGEPEQHLDEPAVLTESIPGRIGTIKRWRKGERPRQD